MELIDRYLQSVKSMLPRKQQDDVIRELNDEILSRVEEKEDALGRPLNEDEQVALLKQLGRGDGECSQRPEHPTPESQLTRGRRSEQM